MYSMPKRSIKVTVLPLCLIAEYNSRLNPGAEAEKDEKIKVYSLGNPGASVTNLPFLTKSSRYKAVFAGSSETERRGRSDNRS